jgi:hypothetical protein
LEAKLANAKAWINQMSHIKSAKGFLSEKDINQLELELETQKAIIHNSSVAEYEVNKHEEKIAQIKSSGKIISSNDKAQIQKRINEMQESIGKAENIRKQISALEKDLRFCSQAEIEKLQNELDSAQDVLKKIQPLNQGKLITHMIIYFLLIL